jgi:hypothetical protein
MSTTKIDLDRDYNINGRAYTKGKQVDVDNDHVTAINDLQKGNQDHLDWSHTHHGAVPISEDPQAATAQTPTRPLGGDHLRMSETAVNTTATTSPEIVKDPSEDVPAKENAVDTSK